MTSPAAPLVWPEHFPPKTRWDRFFVGIRGLGPDLSFFEDLAAQQAGRTDTLVAAWSDERERQVALALGQCLQANWGWKTPYFIPADQTLAVLGGPDAGSYLELDLADGFRLLEEQLGNTMPAGFWETAIDWGDKNGCFGDLVRRIIAALSLS
jgi:hypothetical protein